MNVTSASTDIRIEVDPNEKTIEGLLGKGQEKNLDTIVDWFRDSLFSDSVTEEGAVQAASYFSKTNVNVLGEIFGTNWTTSSNDKKEVARRELRQLKGAKSAEKKVAVAERLVNDDPAEAAAIIFHLLTAGKSPSEIPKGTEDAIRSRFLSSKSRTWTDLKSEDEEILKALVSIFVQWAEEIRFESPGFLHNFLKWAVTTLPRVSLDDGEHQIIAEKLDRLIARLPEVSQRELRELKKPQIASISPSSTRSSDDVEVEVCDADDQKHSDMNFSTRDGGENDDSRMDRSTIDDAPSQLTTSLTEQAERLLHQKRIEISIYERLLEEIETLQEQLGNSRSEIERETSRANQLSLSRDTLEKKNHALNSEKEALTASEQILRSDLAGARRSLEETSKDLESERREYADKVERKSRLEVESFKGRLKQNLAPMFKDKKRSDEEPLSQELADYLRTWSIKLEKTLRDQGIDI